MIDRKKLLEDLQRLLPKVEADLLERSDSAEVPDVGRTLREEYTVAQAAERTAQSFEEWRSDAITQAAAVWVLSCVFVRFLEDNELVETPKISGPGDRLKRARDEPEVYFHAHPTHTDRDYLLAVFDGLTKHAATKDVFGEHNPIRDLPKWLSGDAAGELIAFFQRIDPNSGVLVHDFIDPTWDTRFLGDLYQDLSEAARKKYALLQTPVFVEEFILDRTLDPAIEEFGLAKLGYERRLEPDGRLRPDDRFKMIDLACGSGHFLLGSFQRLVERWRKKEPGLKDSVLVQRALDSVHGVDVNPYAIAIARFRLLLAALKETGVTRLSNAPGFAIHLACGDSLLHGSLGGDQLSLGWSSIDHVYQPEDRELLERLLRPKTYHAVVANPPYITPKDAALNQAYRDRYTTCHRQYSLAVPFLERIVSLAVDGGFTGQITANSFMKREFGKKLIEEFFPRVDLTHVIDTSGAYIPGHGTPTVILFARNRKPVARTLRTVLGIRGEPSTPEDSSKGLVWSAIVAQVDQAGSKGDFVSVGDSPRELFHEHPWSIGGGGAAELKARLEEHSESRLDEEIADIGRTSHTGEDDAFYFEPSGIVTLGLRRFAVPLITGEDVRDYQIHARSGTLFPYDRETGQPVTPHIAALDRHFWRLRTSLRRRRDFGQFIEERGLRWFDHSMFFPNRYRTPLSITFAAVATHNHFVLDRGGKVFNRHAPAIKLPPNATEDDHLALLGLLNSSTACFWMKQVFHDKGSTVDSHGARQTTVAFENFREFTSTGLLKFPVTKSRPTSLSSLLDDLAQRLSSHAPCESLHRWESRGIMPGMSIRDSFEFCRREWIRIREQMIALQEELDWECYRLYGLTSEDLTHRKDVGQPPPAVPTRPTDLSLNIGPEEVTAGGGCPTRVGVGMGPVGQPPSAVTTKTRVGVGMGPVGQPPPAVTTKTQPESRPTAANVGQPPSAVTFRTQPRAKPTAAEYRRKLPHLQAEGRTYAITFCTKDRWVLPVEARDRVLQHCLHDNGVKLHLHVAVVMPDHVHLLLTPRTDREGNSYGLSEIMSGIKGASAHSVNRMLQRKGAVWQDESFDHILRSDEGLEAQAEYLCQNPVRKGLASRPEDYPWLWRESVEGRSEETAEGGCPTGDQESGGEEPAGGGCPTGDQVSGGEEPAGGGCPTGIPGLRLGQRAFEIVLARKMAAGETQTTWFQRHGSTPITELPAEWLDDYRQLVERRIALIERDPNIRLIEQPEYKRRWNTEPWESQLERALREWLLDRLENYSDFDGRMNDEGLSTAKLPIGLVSVAKLADVARQDNDFLQVGELYRDDPAFDVSRLVAELVEAESVPLLPVLRYKPAGLRKREEWEKTWALQRQEDAIDARTKLPKGHPDHLSELDAEALKKKQVGTILVPPKYTSADFLRGDTWRLRGKLDVAKERWVSFPHCPAEDGTLLVAWAGYDHLQLARAISVFYVDVQERFGGRDDPRLGPLLACLIELLPWLKQWHNEVDPEFGVPMGDYFEGFLQEESRNLGLTLDEIKGWTPTERSRGRGARKPKPKTNAE